MRVSDIGNGDLRAWVQSYIEENVAKKKGARISAQSLLDIWRSYTEPDWRALKELIDLREQAEQRLLSRSEIEVAILDEVRKTPGHERYSAPYTLGLEAIALRSLLGVPAPPRSEVRYVEFTS